MARFTSWRVGAVAVAAGLLVAACSGGGGGSDNSSVGGAVGTATNAAPTGIAGSGSGSASRSKSASKSAKASTSRSATHRASSTPARASSSSRSSGGRGGGHSTSSAPPVDNGCRSSAPPAASDPSKASITVCKAVGLNPTASADCPKNATPCVMVTITGHSFRAREGLIATQCHYLGENADNYGLSECNIGSILNFSPAKTLRSDANGNVGPITLPVVLKFKKIDCSKVRCLVSVAVPLQNSAADNPHVLISFS